MPRLMESEVEAYKEKYRQYLASQEEPEPTLTVPSTETYPSTSLAYRQAVEGRVPMTPKIIEQQITSVYRQAPIETRYRTTPSGARVATGQVYAPTPQQEQQIISLAMQLPPEKRAKYVTYEPVKEEPKGLGEFLAGISIQPAIAQVSSWITGTPVKRTRQIQEMQKKVMPVSLRPVEPVKEVGGWVASVEAPVYTVGRLVGIKTPRPPPTYGSGLIGKGAAVFTGAPSTPYGELSQVKAYGPEYARGTILGDILMGYAMGWVGGKAWTGVKKVTPEFIKHPIYQTVKFGRVAKFAHKVKLATPSFRGSRLDVFLAKRSKWFYKATKGIARGEVAIPSVPERIGMPYLKASKLAWEMTAAPRTGGVWIGKVAVAPLKTKVLPHLISRGGLVSIGFLREVSYEAEPYWRRGLLPFVTQQQVTRLGLIPYVPKMVSTTGKKGVSMLGAGLALTVPRLVVPQVPKFRRRTKLVTPKVWQPTFAYEREKFRPLTIELPEAKEREKLIPALKLPQIQEQPQLPKLKVPTLQIPDQVQKPKIPTPQIPTPTFPKIPPLIKLGGGARGRAADRRRFAKWWRKRQKIKTPKQMLATYFNDKLLKEAMEIF